MKTSIIIATYGEERWKRLAMERPFPSTKDQGAHEIIVGHDTERSLAGVRNTLAEKASGEWLCFLDGDDELAPDYLGAMARAFEQEGGTPLHDGILLTPALSFVVSGRWQERHFQREQPLRDGNWLTIGTLLPRGLFMEVGGFRGWGLYEDWDLWARCEMAGARIVKVPDALYLAHYSRRSRNRIASRPERNYWHQMIGHDLWPEHYDSPTGAEHQVREVAGVRKQLTLV